MEIIEELRILDKEIVLLEHMSAVLAWDQESYLPKNGMNERAEQLAFLDSLAHEKITNPKIAELLDKAGSTGKNPSGPESIAYMDRAYLRIMRRRHEQAAKLPADLVKEFSRATSLAQAAWVEAKTNDNFMLFSKHLSAVLCLKREYASCLKPGASSYDALLDEHEEGSSEAETRLLFSCLKSELMAILDKIKGCANIDSSMLHRPCPLSIQTKLARYMMDKLHYDWDSGRIDVSAHPFTTILGESDIRITTRYDKNYFPSGLFSTLHETGHALYELGINPAHEYKRTSLAKAASSGLHESQSRFWENMIGRSLGFWAQNFLAMKSMLGSAFVDLELNDFYMAINKVEPSLTRVEADEVTYALHIILRFELEAALFGGNLTVDELPAAWNQGMQDMLGIKPKNDSLGCLQDIHWALGLFGYFPSYALGNLYAAQLWEAMEKDGIKPEASAAAGDLASVLDWLRSNIHKHGSIYKPKELIKKASGRELDPGCFVKYLKRKYGSLYNF
ncbi:carboxypeptidase M32 [Spirochaetota bacterium]